MNTKGLVELIVLNIGLDVGILTPEVFAIFVLMAVLTTFITSPIVNKFYTQHLLKERLSVFEERSNVLACFPSTKSGVPMVTISHLLYSENTQKPLRYSSRYKFPISY